MTKDNTYEEKVRSYFDAAAKFDLDAASKGPRPESVDKLKEALSHVGIELNYTKSTLTISVDPQNFVRAYTRKSGPKDKKRTFKTNEIGVKGDTVQYSDVVTMMLKKMKDTEIMAEFNMPPATYYRHKKAMMNSDYYKSIDWDRVNEDGYLEGLLFNEAF